MEHETNSRTITVKLEDRTFKVDGVPSETTVEAFLRVIRECGCVDVWRKIGVRISGDILEPVDIISEDNIEIAYLDKRRKSGWRNLFVSLLFLAGHIAPLIACHTDGIIAGIVYYVVCMFILAMFIAVLKPIPNVFSDLGKFLTQSIVVEMIWLFIKSCSPNFRLEHLLLRG